jgi:hypothetical protein
LNLAIELPPYFLVCFPTRTPVFSLCVGVKCLENLSIFSHTPIIGKAAGEINGNPGRAIILPFFVHAAAIEIEFLVRLSPRRKVPPRKSPGAALLQSKITAELTLRRDFTLFCDYSYSFFSFIRCS